MKADFDRLAPEERRIVLVASDDKYHELVSAFDPKSLLGLAGLLFAGGLPVLGVSAAGVFLSKALGSTYKGLLRSSENEGPRDVKALFKSAVTKGEILLPHLSPSEAARRFHFDFGEPEDGAAYLASPIARDAYLKPALANERLAQEKMSAFVRLTATLGAKRIVLVSADVEHKKWGGKASIPLPQLAAQIGVNATFQSDGTASRQVCMEFDPPRAPPSIPDDLEPWLKADPVLRALAETRLTARPRLARAALSFGETIDFGADAMGTLAKLAGRGVELGGAYRRVARSTFSFEVEYYPID